MANRIHPTMERIRSAFFSSIMQTFVFIFFVFSMAKIIRLCYGTVTNILRTYYNGNCNTIVTGLLHGCSMCDVILRRK